MGGVRADLKDEQILSLPEIWPKFIGRVVYSLATLPTTLCWMVLYFLFRETPKIRDVVFPAISYFHFIVLCSISSGDKRARSLLWSIANVRLFLHLRRTQLVHSRATQLRLILHPETRRLWQLLYSCAQFKIYFLTLPKTFLEVKKKKIEAHYFPTHDVVTILLSHFKTS